RPPPAASGSRTSGTENAAPNPVAGVRSAGLRATSGRGRRCAGPDAIPRRRSDRPRGSGGRTARRCRAGTGPPRPPPRPGPATRRRPPIPPDLYGVEPAKRPPSPEPGTAPPRPKAPAGRRSQPHEGLHQAAHPAVELYLAVQSHHAEAGLVRDHARPVQHVFISFFQIPDPEPFRLGGVSAGQNAGQLDPAVGVAGRFTA